MWLQPIYLHLSIQFLNSIKYLSNSELSISFISKLENPGVSAIYVFSSISYNLVSVVVFLPFLFFLLTSPSCVLSVLNIAFIRLDFPTPEFPENTLTLFFNISFTSSIPLFSFALVTITLYPTLEYSSFISI
mgnify:CR=1 FL=1